MNSYIGGLPLTSKKKILLYLLVIVLSQENPKETHSAHTHTQKVTLKRMRILGPQIVDAKKLIKSCFQNLKEKLLIICTLTSRKSQPITRAK